MLRVFTKSLTANERWQIDVAGDRFRCTEGDEEFTVLLNKPASADPDDPASHDFERIIIVNGATAQTVTLYVGADDFRRGGKEEFAFQRGFGYDRGGDVDDARLTLTGGSTLPTATASYDVDPAADATIGTASSTLIAANASRRGVHIRADTANGSWVRLSTVGAANASQGVKLRPGDARVIWTTSEITAIAGAAGQTVEVEEIT